MGCKNVPVSEERISAPIAAWADRKFEQGLGRLTKRPEWLNPLKGDDGWRREIKACTEQFCSNCKSNEDQTQQARAQEGVHECCW